MQKKTLVRTYLVREYCEACEEELKFTGNVLYSYPAQYTHQCPKCLKIYYFNESYPKLDYEEVEESY